MIYFKVKYTYITITLLNINQIGRLTNFTFSRHVIHLDVNTG